MVQVLPLVPQGIQGRSGPRQSRNLYLRLVTVPRPYQPQSNQSRSGTSGEVYDHGRPVGADARLAKRYLLRPLLVLVAQLMHMGVGKKGDRE